MSLRCSATGWRWASVQCDRRRHPLLREFGFALLRRCVRKAETRCEVCRIVMKEILPVVAKPDGECEVRLPSKIVLHRGAEHLLEKRNVRLALLQHKGRRLPFLERCKTLESVGPGTIRIVIKAATADIRRFNT